MYEDFFGLNRKPFELSPDPSFICPSERTKEALASIHHAVSQRKGIAVLTGEAGTGKTLILRCLFAAWKREGTAFANIFAPRFSVIDFLTYAAADLGIETADMSKANLLRAFYGFVLGQCEKGLTTVLVIDEAHQTPTNVLEEIRMLTNVETDEEKLVQILLVGQPELDAKLDSFELRQLKQRVAVRCQLEPLSEEESRHYIEERLRLAGANTNASRIFPWETVNAIYAYSRGIPRVMNSICDHALAVACDRRVRVVPADIIEAVASQFRLVRAYDSNPRRNPWKGSDPEPLPLHVNPRVAVLKNPARPVDDPQDAAKQESRSPANVQTEIDNQPSRGVHQGPERANADSIPRVSASVVMPGPSEIEGPVDASECSSARATEHGSPSNITTEAAVLSLPDSPIGSKTWPVLWKLLLSAGALLLAVGFSFGGILVSRRGPDRPSDHSSRGPAESGSDSVVSQADAVMAPSPLQLPSGVLPALVALPAPAIASDAVLPAAVAEPETHTSTSTRTTDETALRPKIAPGKLSLPIAKSQVFSESEPPPLLNGEQDSTIDGDLLGHASISPVRPAGSPMGGNLEEPKLISSSAPAYPSLARMRNIEGVVVIDALVDTTGKVADMKVISGPASLAQSAMSALRTWRYQPAKLNEQPIDIHTIVRLDFKLP